MKKILLAISILLLFVSCSKEGGSNDYSKLIIGKWDIVKNEYGSDEDGSYKIITEDYTLDDYTYYERWIFDAYSLSFRIKVDKKTGVENRNLEETYLYELHDKALFLAGMKWAEIISLSKNKMVLKQDKYGKLFFVKR